MTREKRIELCLTQLVDIPVEMKGTRRFLKHDIYLLEEDKLIGVSTHKRPLESVEYAILYVHLQHGRAYALKKDVEGGLRWKL